MDALWAWSVTDLPCAPADFVVEFESDSGFVWRRDSDAEARLAPVLNVAPEDQGRAWFAFEYTAPDLGVVRVLLYEDGPTAIAFNSINTTFDGVAGDMTDAEWRDILRALWDAVALTAERLGGGTLVMTADYGSD